jgi:hypothetical protein
MRRIYAYLMGVWEFRSDFTLSFDDYALDYAYDCGRDMAHALTLRYWDAQ